MSPTPCTDACAGSYLSWADAASSESSSADVDSGTGVEDRAVDKETPVGEGACDEQATAEVAGVIAGGEQEKGKDQVDAGAGEEPDYESEYGDFDYEDTLFLHCGIVTGAAAISPGAIKVMRKHLTRAQVNKAIATCFCGKCSACKAKWARTERQFTEQTEGSGDCHPETDPFHMKWVGFVRPPKKDAAKGKGGKGDKGGKGKGKRQG